MKTNHILSQSFLKLILSCLIALPLILRLFDFQSNGLHFSHFSLEDRPISIVIYVIFGAFQKNIQHDIRGHFWEPQLRNFTKDTIIVNYISDFNMSIPGLNIFQVEYDSYFPNLDKNDRTVMFRTSETWHHFASKYKRIPWYFRGTHDTYINLLNLKSLIHELEKKYNPMKDIVMRYGLHEHAGLIYPHGGSGYLFSNAAVRLFATKYHEFRKGSKNCLGDDTCMPFFMKKYFNLNATDYGSDLFIFSYPIDDPIHISQNFSAAPMCPEHYQVFKDSMQMKPHKYSSAVSMHMHRVNMDEVVPRLDRMPENIALSFSYQNSSMYFCRTTW